MKRSIVCILISILAVSLAALTMTACADPSTHKGVVTVDIATAEDLAAIVSDHKLGADYDKATFRLTEDIDLSGVASWTPIGSDYDNSFRSVFDGNGHTISGLKITDESPSPEKRQSVAYEGLFGFTAGATIKNLTLEVDFDFPSRADNNYVGGLIGFSYGDLTIENVTVSGSIFTTIEEIDRTFVKDDGTDHPQTLEHDYIDYMYQYTGGIVGYASGKVSLTDVVSNVGIVNKTFVDDYAIERHRLYSNTVGGVVGYVRTFDIVSDTVVANSIRNAIFGGSIEVYAGRLNVGGIVGAAYNTAILNAKVVSGVSVIGNGKSRANLGGLIGFGDRISVTGLSNAQTVALYKAQNSLSKGASFNLGGAVGYAAGNSVLKDLAVFAFAPDGTAVPTDLLSQYCVDYGGGLVGFLNNSSLEESFVYARFRFSDYIGHAVDLDVTMYDQDYAVKLGGVAGRIYGASLLKQTAADTVAYQGLVADLMDRVKYEKDPDNEDEGTIITFSPNDLVAEQSNTYIDSNVIAPVDGGYVYPKNAYGQGQDDRTAFAAKASAILAKYQYNYSEIFR